MPPIMAPCSQVAMEAIKSAGAGADVCAGVPVVVEITKPDGVTAVGVDAGVDAGDCVTAGATVEVGADAADGVATGVAAGGV